ncbi:MAG TPA: FMN-binding protein, partial [Candidatus Faecivivens stercoravium]|nr:FMN-binding protein [Candidatus Faecivivens stercoravium]
STISADATLLAGIEVVSQDETEYYGDNISKESYTSRFTGRLFPVLSSTDSGVGSKVDGWTGATYSSNAVIQAIDDAYRYVTEQMMG